MQRPDRQNPDELEELASILDALEDDGRYRVERTLKDSGYETTQVVYRADGFDAGPFVRKVFAADSGCGQAYASVYQAQTRGMRFAHQPMIYDFSQTDERISVVMEHIDGITLTQLVQREGPSAALAAQVGVLLCDALSELHEMCDPPIIHRDIKPSNIMMAEDRLFLIDLGIARVLRQHASCDTVRFGTPGYAPPEQFGYGQTDVRSDVYAAGMVISFCLTGKENNDQLRDCGFDDACIPPAMRYVLERATAFDPKMRYGSAREMGVGLRQSVAPASFASPSASTIPAYASTAPSSFGVSDAPTFGTTKVAGVTAAGGLGSQTASLSGFGAVSGQTQDADMQPSAPEDKDEAGCRVWIGRVWNCAIVALWLLLAGVAVSLVFDPNDSVGMYPLWFRAVGYLFVVIIPSALVGYLAMYKKDIRARVRFLSLFNWKGELLFCALAIFCSLVVMAIVVSISGL